MRKNTGSSNEDVVITRTKILEWKNMWKTYLGVKEYMSFVSRNNKSIKCFVSFISSTLFLLRLFVNQWNLSIIWCFVFFYKWKLNLYYCLLQRNVLLADILFNNTCMRFDFSLHVITISFKCFSTVQINRWLPDTPY